MKKTIKLLHEVSGATVTANLIKRGLSECVMTGVRGISEQTAKLVGPAYTLRNIPKRSDKVTGDVLSDKNYAQRVMLEQAPRGSVVVLDCHGEINAAIAGDLMVARLKYRGVAGLVGDGGLRDVKETREMFFPVYCGGFTPNPSTSKMFAFELQVPIGCGGVAVFPNDIIFADNDGVVVIPTEIASEVAEQCLEQEQIEKFCRLKLDSGATIVGTYPPDEKTMEEYRLWKSDKTQ